MCGVCEEIRREKFKNVRTKWGGLSYEYVLRTCDIEDARMPDIVATSRELNNENDATYSTSVQ
jgi:hypothetical protein